MSRPTTGEAAAAAFVGRLAARLGVATPTPMTAPRAPRRRGKPVFDCRGGCGRRVAAWRPQDAACAECLPRFLVEIVPPPPPPDVDMSDCPF